jgi:adenosylcobinamide-GDP ribazoletransferase
MFFTRIPVPKWTQWSPTVLERSSTWFSSVGIVVGGIGAVVAYVSLRMFGPLVAAVLSTLSTVLATGAFHEDGLADTCDAMFGARERVRVLEIMKDSRIGSFGATGLILVLALKISTLTLLFEGQSSWIRDSFDWNFKTVLCLPVAHCLSRLGATGLLRILPYVRENDDIGAKSKPMAKQVSTSRLSIASLIAIGFCGLFLTTTRLAIVLATTLATSGLMALWFRRRIGGYTGDCLGATQQVVEVAALLSLVALWNN